MVQALCCGRAIGQAHRTRTEEQRAKKSVRTIAVDYTFMVRGDGEEGRAKPILVAKRDKNQSLAATFVDATDTTAYAVKFLVNFLKQLGVDEAVMKSDAENSIDGLKDAAAKAASIEATQDESAVGEHQTNGVGENAINQGDQEAHQTAEIWIRRGHWMAGRRGKAWREPAIPFGERIYFRAAVQRRIGISEKRCSSTAQQEGVQPAIACLRRSGSLLRTLMVVGPESRKQ